MSLNIVNDSWSHFNIIEQSNNRYICVNQPAEFNQQKMYYNNLTITDGLNWKNIESMTYVANSSANNITCVINKNRNIFDDGFIYLQIQSPQDVSLDFYSRSFANNVSYIYVDGSTPVYMYTNFIENEYVYYPPEGSFRVKEIMNIIFDEANAHYSLSISSAFHNWCEANVSNNTVGMFFQSPLNVVTDIAHYYGITSNETPVCHVDVKANENKFIYLHVVSGTSLLCCKTHTLVTAPVNISYYAYVNKFDL